MTRLVTAKDVEAAAGSGDRHLAVDAGDLVTPLARDRAAALGVTMENQGAPAQPPAAGEEAVNVARLAAESRVRVVARRHLLRTGRSLDELEAVVAAVIDRIKASGGCLCNGAACGRGGKT